VVLPGSRHVVNPGQSIHRGGGSRNPLQLEPNASRIPQLASEPIYNVNAKQCSHDLRTSRVRVVPSPRLQVLTLGTSTTPLCVLTPVSLRKDSGYGSAPRRPVPRRLRNNWKHGMLGGLLMNLKEAPPNISLSLRLVNHQNPSLVRPRPQSCAVTARMPGSTSLLPEQGPLQLESPGSAGRTFRLSSLLHRKLYVLRVKMELASMTDGVPAGASHLTRPTKTDG
jgi:hypothetical protein